MNPDYNCIHILLWARVIILRGEQPMLDICCGLEGGKHVFWVFFSA